MCVLIWATLLFAVRSSSADTVGHKCEDNCNDSDIILRLNNTDLHAQSEFGGQESLLEPDLSLVNCSIISDLIKSEFGSYQLPVLNVTTKGNASQGAFITVKDLIQKPTVIIPPLTEGQQATLTCTALGLCSGSDPEITWMWRGAGGNDSHITGNITAFKTENLTAVIQRYNSTLTFNPSAIHKGTEVVCKVSFHGMTAEETVTLNVNYVKKPEISGKTTVKRGDTLNLTCSVDSLTPYVITWTKLDLNETLINETGADLHHDAGMATLVIPNMTENYSGLYTCTAKHLNNTLTEEVKISVMYVKKPEITGKRTIKEGDTLNLTCSIDGFPPSLVMWTKVPSNKDLQNRTETDLQNYTGTATLVITNVTADHTGQYICTAKHLNMTVTVCADVTVTSNPKILNSSGCRTRSELLTCMCMSQSQWFPLPTIRWPLLENHTEYSVTTTASNHTVNSTMMLTVKGQSITVVECVSSSENGEVKENLLINKAEEEEEEEDQYMKLLRTVTRLEVIIAFLTGALLSAVICCLVRSCHRKKQRTSKNLTESLEMVTSHKDPLIDAGQAVEDDQAFVQEAPEAGGAAVTGKSDVEYSDLDFSLIKGQSPAEAGTTQGTTEAEYAEIKKEKSGQRQDGEGREEEVVMGVHEETKESGPEEEVVLYSTVEEIMDQL